MDVVDSLLPKHPGCLFDPRGHLLRRLHHVVLDIDDPDSQPDPGPHVPEHLQVGVWSMRQLKDDVPAIQGIDEIDNPGDC